MGKKTKPFVKRSQAVKYTVMHSEDGQGAILVPKDEAMSERFSMLSGSAIGSRMGRTAQSSKGGSMQYEEEEEGSADGDDYQRDVLLDELLGDGGDEQGDYNEDDEYYSELSEEDEGFAAGGLVSQNNYGKKQIEKDRRELCLPDDGYDYTQHLKAPGDGVFMQAQKLRWKPQPAAEKELTEEEREVLAMLEADEDDSDVEVQEVTIGEEAEHSGVSDQEYSQEDAKLGEGESSSGNAPSRKIVQVGDLEEDFVALMGGELKQDMSSGRGGGGMGGPNFHDPSIEQEMAAVRAMHAKLVESGEMDVIANRVERALDALDDSDSEDSRTGRGGAGNSDALFDDQLKDYADSRGLQYEQDSDEEFEEEASESENGASQQKISAASDVEKQTEQEHDGIAWAPKKGTHTEAIRPLTSDEKQYLLNASTRIEESEIPLEKDKVAGLRPGVDDEEDEEEQWDCESILSTYSNLENHPNVVREISAKKSKKIKMNRFGIPLEGLPEVPEPEDVAKDFADEDVINQGKARERGESAEDKKARKAAVKAQRKANREAKKQLKGAYTNESMKRAHKQGDGIKKFAV